MALFRAVLARDQERIDWRVSYQVTMAGVGATRLFHRPHRVGAAALWDPCGDHHSPNDGVSRPPLRRSHARAGDLRNRVHVGVFPGPAPFGLTVIPAAFGAAIIALTLALTLIPADLAERLRSPIAGPRMTGRWMATAVRARRDACRWRSHHRSPCPAAPRRSPWRPRLVGVGQSRFYREVSHSWRSSPTVPLRSSCRRSRCDRHLQLRRTIRGWEARPARG